MNHYKMLFSRNTVLAAIAGVFLMQSAVFAGPPLLCHPFEIGSAKSLPFQGPDWSQGQPGYDVSRLVDDTMALLKTETPVIVRMETLRRATIYARNNSQVADNLLQRLKLRAAAVGNRGPRDPERLMSVFDLGYLAETYRQAAWISQHAGKDYWSFKQSEAKDIDGYALVVDAIGNGGGPEMEFAAALITSDKQNPKYKEHLQKAMAGGKEESLLASNLNTHFGTVIKATRVGAAAR